LHCRPQASIHGEVVGKYVIAWLLGVPAVVLVLVYVLFN
jgi:hypothetical protein